MSEPVLIALIAAGATILAAFISIIRRKTGSTTIIRQKNKGNGSNQIGIVNMQAEKQEKDNTIGRKK